MAGKDEKQGMRDKLVGFGKKAATKMEAGIDKMEQKIDEKLPDSVKEKLEQAAEYKSKAEELAKEKAQLAKEKAEEAAEKMNLKEKIEAANAKLGEFEDKVAKMTEKERAWAAEKAALAKQIADEQASRAKALAEEKVQMAKDFAEKQKEEVIGKVNQAIEAKLDDGLDKLQDVVKEGAKDPYMPGVVKKTIDGAVEMIWPDVKEEVVDAVMSQVRKTVSPPMREPRPWCPNPFPKLRALFIYVLMPYDKSIWQNLRNPFYILLRLISMIPRWGVPQIFYLLIFLMKDKSDEYQLSQFILGFKGVQFISVGILSAIVGAAQYYACVNFSDRCELQGPRDEKWTLVFFLLQIILVWAAFLMLPYSQKKGDKVYKVFGKEKEWDKDGDGTLSGDELRVMRKKKDAERRGETVSASELPREDCCGKTRYPFRGGRLLPILMGYDLIISIVCVVLIIVAWLAGPDSNPDDPGHVWINELQAWKFAATLYWIKILYGLLSFPFLVFKIPVLNTILVHSKATGYGPNGETCRLMTKKERLKAQPSNADQVV